MDQAGLLRRLLRLLMVHSYCPGATTLLATFVTSLRAYRRQGNWPWWWWWWGVHTTGAAEPEAPASAVVGRAAKKIWQLRVQLGLYKLYPAQPEQFKAAQGPNGAQR